MTSQRRSRWPCAHDRVGVALAAWLGLIAVFGGCSRAYHRESADQYGAILLNEREFDWRWRLPGRGLPPDRRSRMRDPSNPDRGPLPPDDPAAHRYMVHPYRFRGWKGWDRRGVLPSVEDPYWQTALPRNEEGSVVLSSETVTQLGLIHSRDYQTEVERLYLAALDVSFQRFQLDAQWFAGTGANYLHSGTSSLPGESNLLTVPTDVRLQKNLAWGGQLLADFANSFVWEFTGKDQSFASSGLLVQFTQPLLRGAFKQIALEGLTQSERNLLYAVRSFTRFRRVFYVDIMSQYLNLLAQAQQIRNQESNLSGLERSLREHEELAATGLVAPIQVAQVFQQYQSARLGLLSAQLGLQTSLDSFKVRLGLPPQLEVTLDQSLLAQFRLNDPRLDRLREENETLFLSLLQDEAAPSLEGLKKAFEQLTRQQSELQTTLAVLRQELSRWEEQLGRLERELAQRPPEASGGLASGDPRADRPAEIRRQKALATRLRQGLADVEKSLVASTKSAASAYGDLGEATRDDSWRALRQLTGKEFRTQVTDAFVIESQVRVYLIALPAFELASPSAVQLAIGNRLDLMNQRGLVVDAYRKVEVAGNALQGRLDITGSANLLTLPGVANPVQFTATSNLYRLGLRFDSPLTRRAERNAYRASQIQYQQTRRAFMQAQDNLALSIRSQLRNLEVNRFQFEIARQTLVAAARQVDEAQISLRAPGERNDSSVTLFLLNAYTNLLGATNGLISGWVSYEITRMSLFRDLDLLTVDGDGRWINARETFSAVRRPADEPSVVPAPVGRGAAGRRGADVDTGVGNSNAGGPELIPPAPPPAIDPGAEPSGSVEKLPEPGGAGAEGTRRGFDGESAAPGRSRAASAPAAEAR